VRKHHTVESVYGAVKTKFHVFLTCTLHYMGKSHGQHYPRVWVWVGSGTSGWRTETPFPTV